MTTAVASGAQDRALGELLARLEALGYRFVTPTPRTHARVLARPGRRTGGKPGRVLEDALGWSLPFNPALLPPEIADCLHRAGVLVADGAGMRASIRVSTLHGRLFLHSAYPTLGERAVFFGPDSYRFADLIVDELERAPPPPRAHIVDIATGSGVGAIVAAGARPDATVIGSDINPVALRLARLNAAAAGVAARFVETSGLDGMDRPIDLALVNPPFIADDIGRAYRDGGGAHGGALPLMLADAAMARLAPGGRLILYTGSAIVAGRDALRAALAEAAAAHGQALAWREIDPDVFGEELERPSYADVDRIALVAAIVTRPAG